VSSILNDASTKVCKTPLGFLLPPSLAPGNDTEAAVAAAAEVANAAAAQAATATTAAAEAAAAAAVAVDATVDTNADAVAAVGTSDDGEVALTKLVSYTKTTYDAVGTPIEIPVFQLGHCETDGCHRHFLFSRMPNWCSCYLLQWGTIMTASTVGSLLRHFNNQNVFCRSATAKISPRHQVPEQQGRQL
jgi:phage-related tail fiber protein